MINTKKIFTVSFVLCLFACGGTSSSDLTGVQETGVTATTAAADDAATGMVLSSIDINEIGGQGVVADDNTQVEADEYTCTADWSACGSDGKKTRSVTCTDATSGNSYTKSVTLAFFLNGGSPDTTCKTNSAGKYFVRTYTSTLTDANGTYTDTTVAANNYLGTSIGGGTTITRGTGTNYLLSIGGITRTLASAAGKTVWNHSIHSDPAAPLQLNQLARAGRIISSGTVIVDHNLAKFTANMAFSDVTYTAGCCYPTSGTIATTYTGSKTGTATLTFSSTCGSASLVEGSTTTAMTMKACSSSTN